MVRYSQLLSRSLAGLSIVLISLGLAVSGCSKSSGGGGDGLAPQATKPDLSAATAVGQSLTVVKNAGQPA